jgi:hypothetical protein
MKSKKNASPPPPNFLLCFFRGGFVRFFNKNEVGCGKSAVGWKKITNLATKSKKSTF